MNGFLKWLCFAGLAVITGLALLHVPASAETLWLNALLNDPDPDLVVTQAVGIGSIQIQSLVPGVTRWIEFPVAIPSNYEVNSVEVCYELSDPGTYISQIRLTEMRTPNSRSVLLDDATDRTATGPICVTTPALSGHSPNGVLTVSLLIQVEDEPDYVRIGGIGLNFSPNLVGIEEGIAANDLRLLQNYPNPFASSTSIEFRAPEAGEVEVRVYAPTGQLVRKLRTGQLEAGPQRVVWDAKNDVGERLPPGVYFYQVRMGEYVGAKQMVLAR